LPPFTVVVMRGALMTERVVAGRPLVLLPLVGLAIAGWRLPSRRTSNQGVDEVLCSGQDQLPGLVTSGDYCPRVRQAGWFRSD
jgi:hypothetical protein